MDFNYYNSFKVEEHPFETFIPANATSIIVGTFPTHKKNRLFEWYYGGDGNRFWEIIECVMNCHFKNENKKQAVTERQDLMKTCKVAMTDMVKRCHRRSNLSQDHNIFPIELNDLVELLNRNQTIETVVFTSRTPVVGALGIFKTLLLQKGIEIPEMQNHEGMLEGWFPLKHREISLLVPYSPSKSLAEKQYASKEKLVKMYKSCF